MKPDQRKSACRQAAGSLLFVSMLAGCAVYGPPPGAGEPVYVDQPEYYYAPIYSEPFWLFDADFYGGGRDHRRGPEPRDRDPRGGDHRGGDHRGGDHGGADRGGADRGGADRGGADRGGADRGGSEHDGGHGGHR